MASIKRVSRRRLRQMAYDKLREDPEEEDLLLVYERRRRARKARRELQRRGEKL